MTHGGEDRTRGVDVRSGRNSMNCYRLAAHFASRSCDGLVKRFGLSSTNPSRQPSPPPHFSSSCRTNINARNTDAASSRRAVPFFFHCAPPRRPAGVVKRVTGVVGHSGFSKRKTSHEDACSFEFHGVNEEGGEKGEREDEGGESRSGAEGFIKSCSPLLPPRLTGRGDALEKSLMRLAID